MVHEIKVESTEIYWYYI